MTISPENNSKTATREPVITIQDFSAVRILYHKHLLKGDFGTKTLSSTGRDTLLMTDALVTEQVFASTFDGSRYDAWKIVVLEKRPYAYLTDLCELIEDVTGTTVEHADRQLTLTPDAATDLGLEYLKLA